MSRKQLVKGNRVRPKEGGARGTVVNPHSIPGGMIAVKWDKNPAVFYHDRKNLVFMRSESCPSGSIRS